MRPLDIDEGGRRPAASLAVESSCLLLPFVEFMPGPDLQLRGRRREEGALPVRGRRRQVSGEPHADGIYRWPLLPPRAVLSLSSFVSSSGESDWRGRGSRVTGGER
uniref:Uncharacterized protein n=1 Tax=Arundo donax TaxID=35708 RepID=A0A0A9F7I6_ARUDO